MDKLKALMITGSLEVKFEGRERLLNEVKILQKNILEDDVSHVAIEIGRLREMLNNLAGINADEKIIQLRNCILLEESNANLDLPIDEMEFTVRTYNALYRAGIRIVRQLVALSLEELKNVLNLGEKSVDEVVIKLKNLGFELS